ncbi:MAG: ABC transporter permease, partial [Gaiellales bacterium]
DRLRAQNPNAQRGEARKLAAMEWRQEFFNESNATYKKMYSGRREVGTGQGQRGIPATRAKTSGQLRLLLSRYFKTKIRDVGGTIIMLAQAPIIGILLGLVFGGQETSVPGWCLGAMQQLGNNNKDSNAQVGTEVLKSMTKTSDHTAAIFFLVVSAIWFGTSNAAREIVSERAIYMRERMVNLGLVNYVLSKYLLLGVLLLLPAIHSGGGVAIATTPAVGHHRHGIHGGTSATNQPAGPDLRGFGKDVPTPSLAGIGASSTRKGGATSKDNPYGGGTGTANHGPTGSVQPASRTVGNAGYLQNSHTSSSKTNATSEGKAGGGKATLTTNETAAAGKVASAGPARPSPITGGQKAAGADSTAGTPGQAGPPNGGKRGGGGSSAAGRNDSQAGGPRQATPGGATAGGTRGTQASARGVVPQLGAGKTLPIQPGYQAVKGTKGAKGEAATSANGAGGASHSGQATTGAAAATSGGVAYVPPGSSAVAPADRRLLIGYFGSFARIAAAGW